MTVGIYGIFNIENNDCLYIGQSNNIEKRVAHHLNKLKNGKHKRREMQHYYDLLDDVSNIQCFIIEETQDEHFIKNESEIKWFQTFEPLFYGVEPSLNATNWSYNEETKNKIRNSLKRGYQEGSVECSTEGCTITCYRGKVFCKKCLKHAERNGNIEVYNVTETDIENIISMYKKRDIDCVEISYNMNIPLAIIYMVLHEKDICIKERDQYNNPLFAIHSSIQEGKDYSYISKQHNIEIRALKRFVELTYLNNEGCVLKYINDKELVNTILRNYNGGKNGSINYFHKELGIPKIAISKILTSNGVEFKGNTNKGKIKNEQEVCDMYKYGYSNRQISKYFEVSHVTIHNILKRNNIPISSDKNKEIFTLENWKEYKKENNIHY